MTSPRSKYLHQTGRDEHRIALVEAYPRRRACIRTASTPDPVFTDTLELDLGTGAAVAGRDRSARRTGCAEADAATAFNAELTKSLGVGGQRRRHQSHPRQGRRQATSRSATATW